MVASSVQDQVKAAEGVLRRTIPHSATSFKLSLLPAKSDGLDQYIVEASNGTVHISATSGVALCRGAYDYIKKACHRQFSWHSGPLTLPAKLPDFAKTTVDCPNQYRHYFNICTFGYTTVWWDFKRWQEEIDWMALHGINMPLAMNGQDLIWQRVFSSFGVPQSSLDKFFSGPAFSPWHWMGNLNGHMGPQPQSWRDGQAKLQKQILAAERSLGMKPVVPGFSGFVPSDFDKYQKSARLQSPSPWCGWTTTFVDASQPIFVQIGKRFVEEYRKEFGSDHLYLCDTFNEQNPQFPAATELKDLESSGRAVYESIRQADPDGIWVMQGWLFYNAANYWTLPRTEALLKGAPDGKMIILDLATNESAVWKRLPSVRNKGWIYNTLHNYGQSTGLYGNLQRFVNSADEDLNNPEHGHMLGMGLTMEGIDQNPIVYELMSDMMWRQHKPDMKAWLKDYVESRYGAAPEAAMSAWGIIYAQVYGQDLNWYRAAWRGRPRTNVQGTSPYNAAQLESAVRDLVKVAPQFKSNPLFQRDLVDITKTWLGVLADARLAGALKNRKADLPLSLSEEKRFFEILDSIDAVMACRPEHRLSTWISDSLKWGKTPTEKILMEQNARTQVTIWGDGLYDYANKEWAGLTKDFLAQRWHVFFDSLRKGKTISTAEWEDSWTKSRTPIRETRPSDVEKVTLSILGKFGGESETVKQSQLTLAEMGLAYHKPVRSSGKWEENHKPSIIVDGDSGGDYWASAPAPQWVEIDLEKQTEIKTIELYPYCDDDREYGYKVEISTDGKTYSKVGEGKGPATDTGYVISLAPVSTRFIRVTMLSNSANQSVHLHEVRVFGPK